MYIFPTSSSEIATRAAAKAVTLAGLLTTAMFLGGCYASLDGFNNNVVSGGPTIEYMKKKVHCEPICQFGACTTCPDWDKPSYHRTNGNPVFCEGKPKCQTHWEVDRISHRIVRWRVEARSGDFWARNHCDFVPPPGRAFSPWYSRLGDDGHTEEEASKSCSKAVQKPGQRGISSNIPRW